MREGYAAALDGLAHGVQIAAVLDLRTSADRGPRRCGGGSSRAVAFTMQLRRASQSKPAPAMGGCASAALDFFHAAGADGASAARTRARSHLAIDGLWMSVGFAPANALLHQARAQVSWSDALGQFVPHELPAGLYACGKVNGVYWVRRAPSRWRRMPAPARPPGCLPAARWRVRRRCRPMNVRRIAYPIFAHPKGKEFVDFDEDLQIRDLENACQEGFDSSELLKRFSTIGMGPSQGKHSHMNALRILARVRGQPIEQLGTTTARPMFHPVPLSHLAGRGFTPQRRTPLDAEHAARGAVWMPAGNWRRPEYYALAGRTRDQAIAEEVGAVRTRVGLIDVGTLGKIEVHGPDAAEFLDRVYARPVFQSQDWHDALWADAR